MQRASMLRYMYIVCHVTFNPLNVELNPIGHLLVLSVANPIFHVSGIRVNVQSTQGKTDTQHIYLNDA